MASKFFKTQLLNTKKDKIPPNEEGLLSSLIFTVSSFQLKFAQVLLKLLRHVAQLLR